MDRLVHAALATLVSRSDGVWDAGAGARAGLDDVSAKTVANFVLSDRHPLADRHHSLGELYVSELPRSRSGISLARRPVPAALFAQILESELPLHEGGQTTCRADS